MRCALAYVTVFLLLGMAAGNARAAEPAAVRGAIERGLAFLADDARTWREEHGCASCHHAALVVWSMREAEQRGVAVDQPLLSELTAWMAKSGDGTTSLPRPETVPKALNTKPVYFALALGSESKRSDASQKALELLLKTVRSDQTENGSWASWPETRPPIFGNSDESMTALALLALLPEAAKDETFAKATLDKGVTWLAESESDGDPQSVALRLVLWQRLGRPREECRPLVQHIKGRQNADGGWSQAAGMESDAWATGQALYALAHSGLMSDDRSVQRGQAFLIKSQREDGSWPMTSRPSKPDDKGAENLIPITGAGSAWAVMGLARSSRSDDADVQDGAAAVSAPGETGEFAVVREFVRAHCLDCHDDATKTAGLSLEALSASPLVRHPEEWERVVRQLRARQMPPLDVPRPEEASYDAVVASLGSALDRAAAERPQPGRTDTFRRLNRTEYRNAIRDLLALDVDLSELLPADESSHGFDNVTVGDLTPTLLSRYISAAQKISRLAVGRLQKAPEADTIRVRPDITQESHVAGLPLGTRGGVSIPYTFIQDGRYDIAIRLMRDRNEHVEGLNEEHTLEVLLDRQQVAEFTVKPPRGEHDHQTADAHLETRLSVKAGPHQLGVTFIKQPASLLETKRQPYNAHFNFHRHPRITPAIYQVSITGPYDAQGPGDTPSRRRIFVCLPAGPEEEDACATRILNTLMRRAYRRPIDDEDLKTPLKFYRDARETGDFDAGIEAALSAILVNPHFLFRIERDPSDVASQTAYNISDVELASRLSFFLWSSLPDGELLDLATAGQLSRPEVLEGQVRRMLADARSQSLATNFAGQWLYLRNLESITPDLRLFPDFDDNLRQAFRRETELLFESVVREDRSVLALLDAGDTYLNERLAKHYGIPHVYGSRFRQVALDADSRRGGLLRQGSILTVTSYATRTSPVVRGNWILTNLLGVPAPPPPPDVPALKDNTVSATLPVRERLEEHRKNPACASCHNLMDPVGFSLENFDAIGRWREQEAGVPVDASGGLPDGSRFVGVSGLEQGLLDRPELFAGTMTEKLLTFALGRGIEPFDAPAVRRIVREAREDDYRFSSLIVGIARSVPFQMRTSE